MRHKFVDEVTIQARSGDGGPGCVSFRREKFIPYGGPDGGDGGKGGDVIVRADGQMSTLLDYKFQRRHEAKNGEPGRGRQMAGRDSDDIVLRVPVGTMVYNTETGELLADLDADAAEVVVAKGGRGGKGNEHFKTSTHQAPKFAQPGEPGTELELRLELKLLADVGLVGFPNVGKSSLIARISAARPKIANYPFTTLAPNLGVVRLGAYQHYVVADVPGLVVGAHQGVGLGARFLRHIERVRRIVHMVTVEPDQEDRDVIKDFKAIEKEMRLYNAALADVPRVLVLNRMDLDFVAAARPRLEKLAKRHKLPFFAISAATGEGVEALVKHLGEAVSKERKKLAKAKPKDG
ncbi:MAG: GTPase ObgE [Deltaproteobacteria bacterium]|nr:GTPase ObgE [Deltaproteobacteria bacterium]